MAMAGKDPGLLGLFVHAVASFVRLGVFRCPFLYHLCSGLLHHFLDVLYI